MRARVHDQLRVGRGQRRREHDRAPTQPVQQEQQTPQPENGNPPSREDCPEKEGGGSSGSSGSSDSELQF